MRENENYWQRLRQRPLSRRRFLAGSGVAAAGSAALLAGCGGDDDDTDVDPTAASGDPDPTAAAGETPDPTAAATQTSDAAKRGGTFRNSKLVEDAGLDPAIFHLNNTEVIYNTMTMPYTYQPTKGLFAMDGMTGFEQVDPTTFVWSVRPGMTFHNDDPVTAEDVAFSFRRLAPIYDARGGTHITPPIGFRVIDSIDVSDELTLTENWNEPNADIPIYRSAWYYAFMNQRIVEEQGIDGTKEDLTLELQSMPLGVGSGPYTLTKRDAEGTRLERWPGYWKHTPADDGFVEDGPYIDAWETRIIPDGAAVKAAFLAGDLDVMGSESNGTIDPLELPEFEGNDNFNIVDIPVGATTLFGMDGGKFHDVRARQALQKAVDYEGFIAAIRQGQGAYTGPLSPLLGDLNQLGQEDYKTWMTHEPENARALWEASGIEVDDLKLLTNNGSALQLDIADFVGQSIAQTLGIDYHIDGVDANTWAARAIDRSSDTKDWELLPYGTGLGGGTAGLPATSHLVNYDPRGFGLNAFNFHLESQHQSIVEGSETMISMLAAQEAETDREARAGLLTELQTWILDNHWCNWNLPSATSANLVFNTRLQDQGIDDWSNGYGRRRHSMWLKDA